jgi:hypothetical protein
MKKVLLLAAAAFCCGLLPAQVVRLTKKTPETAKEKLNQKLSSPLFRSFNETIFDMVDENQDAIAYWNVLNWLQGRVAGLQVVQQQGDWVPYIRGGKAACYINEIPVNPGLINDISISDIAMVKIIKGPFAGSFGGGNGAVAIYTK